jgi:hypothetical protein
VGLFYTEKQISETIAALESYSPGIWARMLTLAPITDPSEEQKVAKGAIVRALTIVLPTMPFVTQAQDPFDAKTRLILDIRNAVQDAYDAAKRSAP